MTRRRRRAGGAGSGGFSGWTGIAVGLVVGLSLAIAAWLYLERDSTPEPDRAPTREEPEVDEAPSDFSYHDSLPEFEVVIPEPPRDGPSPSARGPIEQAGAYVLQVGSYRDYTEADRVRAQLALQGIASSVQKVSVDDNTWHRVRIGPIQDLAELNRIRQRLAEAEMDVLVMRVGE